MCAGAQHVSGEGHVSGVPCHVSTQGDSGGSVLTSTPGSEGEEVWSLAGVVSFGSSLGCEVGTWSSLHTTLVLQTIIRRSCTIISWLKAPTSAFIFLDTMLNGH